MTRARDISNVITDANFGGTLDVSGAFTSQGIDDNADAVALSIDSSERVGIGTTSPDALLTVQSSGATTAKIDTSSTSSYAEILLEDGNAGYAFQTRSDNAQSTGTGSLVLNDRDTATFPIVIKEGNPTNSFVMSNSGIITLASQPSIGFQGNNGTNESHGHNDRFGASDDGVSAFTTSTKGHSRTGISYTTTNGRFTVSTAGIYLVYFQAYYNGSSSANIRVDMSVNGIQQVLSHDTSNSGGTRPLAYSLLLSANDYINFQHKTGSAQDFFCGNAHMLGYIIKAA